MSLSLELGSFKLEHRPTHTQADIRVATSLSADHDNPIGFDPDRSVRGSLTDGSLWIARTQGFDLVVQVFGIGYEGSQILTRTIQQAKVVSAFQPLPLLTD